MLGQEQIQRSVLCLLISLAIAGCQTLSSSETAEAEPSISLSSEIQSEPGSAVIPVIDRLDPLIDSKLPDRKCGMILWTLDAQRPTAIFRYISDENAEIAVAGETILLTRTQFDGDSGFGVFTKQTFQSDQGIVVETDAVFGLSFDGGVYLERGIVNVTGADGWSIVSPAAGIAGCRR